MGIGTQAKQIHRHQFTVIIPSVGQKSDFRRPSVRQKGSVFREPRPIHAVKDVVRQSLDLAIREVLPAGQNAAEQNRRVDGRDFRIPRPFARVYVGPVIEEAPVNGQLLPQKPQGGKNSLAGIGERDKASLLPDA